MVKKVPAPWLKAAKNVSIPCLKSSHTWPQINDALRKENVENAENVKTKMRKMLQLTFFAFFNI